MLVNHYEFVAQRIHKKSWTEITKEFNEKYGTSISREALRKRYEREIANMESLGNDLVEKAIKIIREGPVKPTELAKRFNLDIDGLEFLIDDILNSRAAVKFNSGYLVLDTSTPQPDNKEFILDALHPKETIKLGIIADTHLCSVYEKLDYLHAFYKICEEEKVDCVLCAGDFTAGNGTVYKGQLQDLKIVGEDKQIYYICSVYPEAPFKTYIIGGNHDLDLYKQSGSDIISKIVDKREDLVYLGKLSSTIVCGGVKIMLRHGEGALGLIKSYKPQRILDTLPPEEICDITIIGHWHCYLHLPKYRNSVVILPGCFEGKNDYLERKNLTPDVGGALLEIKVAEIDNKPKIVRHKVEFVDFNVFK